MSISNKIEYFLTEFNKIDDWQDKYRYIIQLGKNLQPYPEMYRVDKFKVKGCQSQVWLYAEKIADKVRFFADSDAMIVKGLLALVLDIFSEQKAEDVAKSDLNFVNKLGLTENLTQNRTRGLLAFLKQIKLYALVISSQ